jgi:hypothetical protein
LISNSAAYCFKNIPFGLIKVKGKVPLHTMKVYRGCIGIAPLNLNLGIRWREWSNSHPGYFIPQERTPVPIK